MNENRRRLLYFARLHLLLVDCSGVYVMRMRRCQSMELARYYKRLEILKRGNKKMKDTLKQFYGSDAPSLGFGSR